MSLYRELTAKSWLPEQRAADDRYKSLGTPAYSRLFALRVFLAVVGVLFLLMLIAYSGRMAYEDWRPAPQLRLLWANTAMLLLASVALHWAQIGSRSSKPDTLRAGLYAAAAFTLLFLAGQLLAWRQLAAMDQFDISSPAIGFFYMITGLHGLHILGGMVALGRTIARAAARNDPRRVLQSVELCARYWHFLLFVWLVLFGLLFTGNNFEILLKICGIR